MKHRIFSIFSAVLVLCVLVSAVAVPAFASETSGDFFNVLDYATADGSGGNYFSFTSSRTVRYDLVGAKMVSYLDMLITSIKPITRIVLDMDDSTDYDPVNLSLYLVQQETGTDYYLYRVYGDIPSGRFYSFNLTFYGQPGVETYVEILQFRTSSLISVTNTVYPTMVNIQTLPSFDVFWQTSQQPYYSALWVSGVQVPYNLFFYYDSWQSYDNLQLLLGFLPGELDSIFCMIGDTLVDFELVSYDGTSHLLGDRSFSYPDSQLQLYSLIIDLSGVQRDLSDSLCIGFTGQPFFANDDGEGVCLLDFYILCSVFTVYTSADADSNVTWWHTLAQWFSGLGSTIESGFSSLAGTISEWFNNLFGAVQDGNSSLDEIQNDLHDYINGDVAPSAPAGSDSVDNVGELENTLINNAVGGLDSFGQISTDALTGFNTLAGGFAFLAGVINLFVDGTPIQILFIVSLSLGICGFIFNLLGSVDTGRIKSSKSKQSTSLAPRKGG